MFFYVTHWVTTDFNRKFAKKCRVSIFQPFYREIPLFLQNREYLKSTPNPFSWAAKLLLTSNLDQRYFMWISRILQRDFWKFWFFTFFAAETFIFCDFCRKMKAYTVKKWVVKKIVLSGYLVVFCIIWSHMAEYGFY